MSAGRVSSKEVKIVIENSELKIAERRVKPKFCHPQGSCMFFSALSRAGWHDYAKR